MNTITTKDGQFLDQNCKIEVQGKTFENTGAFIGKNSDGKWIGGVYVNYNKNKVTNWHGDIEIPARFGRIYYSNFGDKRVSVYFRYKGINFFGVLYSMDWNEFINVRKVK